MLTSSSSSAGGPKAPPQLLSASSLEDLPDIEWLIHDLLPVPGIATMYGPSGQGKSFLAIDLALNVASGQPWRGHSTIKAPAVYVAAEGSRGIKGRVRAWQTVHPAADVSAAFFIFESILVHERAEVTRLIQALDRLPTKPRFIILDTLAQNAVGLEENSAKDMGLWLAGAAKLRDRYNATVLIIHHTGKTGELERGSGSLRGAMDTMFKVKREAMGAIELSCEKQKDDECFGKKWFLLTKIPGTGSAVLTEEPGKGKKEEPAGQEAMREKAAELLSVPGTSARAVAKELALAFPDMFTATDPVEQARTWLRRGYGKGGAGAS